MKKKTIKIPQRVRFYNIGMDDELFERIKERALIEDLSMNKLLKKAAKEYLRKVNKQKI